MVWNGFNRMTNLTRNTHQGRAVPTTQRMDCCNVAWIQTVKIAGTVYILQSISIRGGVIRRLAVRIGEKGIREVKVYACSFWCNKDNQMNLSGFI